MHGVKLFKGEGRIGKLWVSRIRGFRVYGLARAIYSVRSCERRLPFPGFLGGSRPGFTCRNHLLILSVP